MTDREQEILDQIDAIKNKAVRSIYDFNKLRKLEKELEEIKDDGEQRAESNESNKTIHG